MRIANALLTLVMLAVLGFAFGPLLARRTKQEKRRQPEETPFSADAVKRLAQLKSQLDSGLITKEEYSAKRQEILQA